MPDYMKLSRKAHEVLADEDDMDCAKFFSLFYSRITPAEKSEIKKMFDPPKTILPKLGLRFVAERKGSGRVARTVGSSGAGHAAHLKACAGDAKPPGPVYVVKYDHDTDGNELSLKAGQVVNVVDKDKRGWWWVEVGDKAGWSPAHYMEERVGARTPSQPPAQADPTYDLKRLDRLAKTILSSGAFFKELYKKIGPEQASALRETYSPSSRLVDDLPSVGHTKTDKSSAIVHLVNSDAPRNAQPVRHDVSLSGTICRGGHPVCSLCAL